MESKQILTRRGKFLDMEGVRGSIPLPPTIKSNKINSLLRQMRRMIWRSRNLYPPCTHQYTGLAQRVALSRLALQQWNPTPGYAAPPS